MLATIQSVGSHVTPALSTHSGLSGSVLPARHRTVALAQRVVAGVLVKFDTSSWNVVLL